MDSMAGTVDHELEALLAALGGKIGQHLALDGAGQCALAGGDSIELVIAAADGGLFSLRSPLARSDDPALLRRALCLNYVALPPGFALGFDEASRHIALLALRSVATTTAEDFLDLVAEVLEQVPVLRASLSPSGDIDSQDVAAGPEMSPDVCARMIRV